MEVLQIASILTSEQMSAIIKVAGREIEDFLHGKRAVFLYKDIESIVRSQGYIDDLSLPRSS